MWVLCLCVCELRASAATMATHVVSSPRMPPLPVLAGWGPVCAGRVLMPLASKAPARALPVPGATDVNSSQWGRVGSRTPCCSWARFKFTHSLEATGGKQRAAVGAGLSGGKRHAIHNRFYSQVHAFMNVSPLSQGHWSFMFTMVLTCAMNINVLLTCWVTEMTYELVMCHVSCWV